MKRQVVNMAETCCLRGLGVTAAHEMIRVISTLEYDFHLLTAESGRESLVLEGQVTLHCESWWFMDWDRDMQSSHPCRFNTLSK